MAFLMTSVSDKLKYHWDRLNKIKSGPKKNVAISYAIGYFVLNQIEITDESFELLKKQLEKFYEQTDKAISDASKKGEL